MSFPILIKLIDARKPLSIQVHPDEVYAKANEGQHGKTEMWYVQMLYVRENASELKKESRCL
ncbi:type I phosphomannose isomerase catalytic subunit [Butyrivibrio sp. AE2015]|uniref:type I phosphomannose isomerase catalytic subunit n=1 Tax=Butyrivibrio sp. AE2015 TaxID=1280663 RepID=UPI003FA45FDE